MAENKFERQTVPVMLGSKTEPLKVLRASTGFDGIKSGQTKGTLFLECLMSKKAADEFESIPEIKALIDGIKESIQAHNAPIQAKIANVPEAVAEQLKATLQTYIDFKQLYMDKDYNPILDENGQQQYLVKFKQSSLAKQIESKAQNIYYVKHFVLDTVTNKFKFLKDEANSPFPKQTFEGGEIVIQMNTKIEQYPSSPKFTLTTSRLTAIYHLKEGTSGFSDGGHAVNNSLGDFEIEDEVVESPKKQDKKQPEENDYETRPTSSPSSSNKPIDDEENAYA